MIILKKIFVFLVVSIMTMIGFVFIAFGFVGNILTNFFASAVATIYSFNSKLVNENEQKENYNECNQRWRRWN